MFTILKKLFLLIYFCILILSEGNIKAQQADGLFDKEDNKLTFYQLRGLTSTFNQIDYFNLIRTSIIEQPEYAFALSTVTEKNMMLKFQRRNRLPNLNLSIINDKIIDRDVDDLTSIRKRQDDSFDVVLEIEQPIYTGGSINSKIDIAKADFNLSKSQKDESFSNLIIDANRIYLSALRSDFLYNYSNNLLNELQPFMDKVKDRVRLGISDPIELAIFSIKYNNLYSKVQNLKTSRDQDIGIYEYFFKTEFKNISFPEVFVPNIEIDNKKSYSVKASELGYESAKNQVRLTRSDYLPQFGFRTRYTNYDIDDSEISDSDIRGGVFFSMPLFTFGRASAKISSARAKANASKMSIDIERKADDVRENELVNLVKSSINTRAEFYNSFLDTREQRKIIGDRLDVVNFSTDALANSFIEEITLLETVLDTEITLLHGYFMFLHQNKGLVSFIGIQP